MASTTKQKDEYTIFKYIIIGEMGVGKSALLAQFTEQRCMCVFAATYSDSNM
jgi:GTP-binding protein EngB required for normal cell division